MNENFINDTIRQLKSGKKCYVFNKFQSNEIKKIYKEKTNLELNEEYDGDYILLKPLKAVTTINY